MKDGYTVEREVGRLIASWPDRLRYEHQSVFQTDDLFARADLVRRYDDGAIDLFEIKGSTSIKATADRDYITDAAFQVHVARRAAVEVRAVHLIHVNGDYVREGDIDPVRLLSFVDVTAEVEERLPTIDAEIGEALELLTRDQIDENGCTCVLFGSTEKRCAAFDHFNPGIPDPSIYLLPRISAKKVALFHSEGRLALSDIDPAELTATQMPIHRAATQGAPVINADAIRAFLDQLIWPLHFYDYETFGSAVPFAQGHEPHQQMPVQYSLHLLSENGDLAHFEFLTAGHGQQRELVDHMEATFQPGGTIIAWNKSFECACNTRMGRLLPDKAEFLHGLNDRTVDLMDPFKADYVDIRFKGSTSIKKVLPVLCPGLRYDEQAVHDGAGAMEAWLQMIEAADSVEKARIRAELLAYCKLDTLAMVEIFRVLKLVVE